MTDDAPTRPGSDQDFAVEDSGGSAETGKGASAEPVIVKKYANRRLYNTATSSYITLENLAAMVRAGQEFVVQDAKSGADITRTVLTQIIFEEEARGRSPMLPVSFLRQLIRLYGDTLQGYVPGYLEMTMQAFERNQEMFRGHMQRSFGANPGLKQLEAMTRANLDVMRTAMDMWTPFAPQKASTGGDEADSGTSAAAGSAPSAAPEPATESGAAPKPGAAPKSGAAPKPGASPKTTAASPAPAAGSDRDAQVDALRRQLEDMQSQLERLGRS